MAVNFSSTYDNKLPKEREDWFITFFPKINANTPGNVVSNRCPTWRRIFDWVKTYNGGVITSGLTFKPNTNIINNSIIYDLTRAFARIPNKNISVTTLKNSHSESFYTDGQIGSNIIDVFSFTTDSSSAREYIFGDFTIILSGSGFNNSGGGAYSWGVRFYFCDADGTGVSSNFPYIEKRVSNGGSSSTYSASVTITTNWNTINYDLSPNTTYKVCAQLFTGNPFDGSATLQWIIYNNSPIVKCFIMDKCPKQFDAFGINPNIPDVVE